MQHLLYLKVENDIHSARVTPITHPHHLVYHVLFEDGYENIFFTDAETGNWIEEDMGETNLAAAFGERITDLADTPVQCKPLSWCTATVAGMVINFGFCTHKDNGLTVFEVYGANRKFLCNLVKSKKGKWEMFGSRRPMNEHQYTNQVQIIISIFESMADAL